VYKLLDMLESKNALLLIVLLSENIVRIVNNSRVANQQGEKYE